MISYVNYASNWSVKLLQNGLYSNTANLNTLFNGFYHVLLVNYNNDTFPRMFLVCFLGFFFSVVFSILVILFFLAYSIYTFWASCFTVCWIMAG